MCFKLTDLNTKTKISQDKTKNTKPDMLVCAIVLALWEAELGGL